jgi:transcription elongation factor GreA
MSSNPEPIFLTAEGAERLRQELEHLVSVKRPALAERLRRAIGQGDLSENADYTSAKEEQGFLEGRIQQLEEMLRRAKIIPTEGTSECVVLGSRVTVIEEGLEEPEVFRLVGPAEADPSNGCLSNESPLGRALLGCRVGDTARVHAPGGEIVFRILAIE